ncbi:MAG: hypothetical protein ACE5M4_12155 [Anaerolineales bacterium]
MSQASNIVLTRRLITSLAAVFLWIAIVTGAFSLVTGSTAIGLLWIGIGLALVIALIQGKLMSRLEGRRVPLASVALIVIVIMLVAITELVNLFITKFVISISYFFDVAYSLGIVILGGYAAFQLLKSPRPGSTGRDDLDRAE